MTVTLITAGILGFLFLILSLRVSLVRRSARISVGDGGNQQLELRCRAQANLAEYLPFTLFLIFLAEQAWGAKWYVIALAAAFVIARILHALGMRSLAPTPPRFIGATLTYAVLALLSFLVLAKGIALLAPCASCGG